MELRVGELVLCQIQDLSGLHKLSSHWDGLRTVVVADRAGAYRLALPDGEELTNSWNADQLRKFIPYSYVGLFSLFRILIKVNNFVCTMFLLHKYVGQVGSNAMFTLLGF